MTKLEGVGIRRREPAGAGSRLLIVEDRDSLRRLLRRALAKEGYAVATAASVADGRKHLRRDRLDLVLTDLKLPDGSGLDVVRASRELQPETPVVVLTAFGTVQTAVEALKLGAVDFLEKPLEIDELSELVASLVGRSSPRSSIVEIPGAPRIVGSHPRFAAALHLLRKVAPTESTVLITGESGTGKELFARALHALSERSRGPFVAVNCAAIPETLMENELFGHEKGAFTGASKRQAGRFELAARGSIFLDEIGELKLEVQGKVLRVLEERTFERVGGGLSLRTDARVVAATNRDLAAMVDRGELRQDLFYRLDVFPIALPPLRKRRSDIPHLAGHLIAEIGRRLRLPPRRLENEAIELLAAQPWPGNVRQLANLLERCLILSDRESIGAHEIAPHFAAVSRDQKPGHPGGGVAGTAAFEGPSEREHIREALRATGGDKRRAADRLEISYRTLQRRIKMLDLEGYPKYRD